MNFSQPFTAPIIIPFTKKRWKNGYTNRIGVTTRIVTVIRMEVAVCVVASICWIASLEVPEETIVASELAWLIYWYRINCNVYNFVSVTRSSVSWKEFHCPTAAKLQPLKNRFNNRKNN